MDGSDNKKYPIDFDSVPTEYLEALGQLSGKLGHDFNNVLASIQGCIELMQSRLESQFPGQKMFERQFRIIFSSIQRGTDITTKIRGFLRPGPLTLDRIDMVALVESVADTIVDSGISRDDIQVIQNSNPAVEANEFLILQVVTGCCANAIEAMVGQTDRTLLLVLSTEVLPEGNDLGIPAGEYAQLAIIDHGKGMGAAEQQRLFQPFFSTKSGKVGEGYGLHLTMADRILRRHNGALKITTESKVGTAITIYLPTLGTPKE
jgi:signal transduction histidine kinase